MMEMSRGNSEKNPEKNPGKSRNQTEYLPTTSSDGDDSGKLGKSLRAEI